MNYLGHFILSYPDEALVTGNFVADFVKGNKYTNYPEQIAQGILMHRFIDEFTDAHAASLSCKELLRPAIGKLSGVALDILYDHIIASEFQKFSSLSLPEFATSIYGILLSNKKHMGLKGKYVYYYMRKHNWLCRYETIEGTNTTLINMSKRISFPNNLPQGLLIYQMHEEFFREAFHTFFTELKKSLIQKGFKQISTGKS